MTQRRNLSGKRGGGDAPKDRFKGEVFEALVEDMQSGRLPLNRTGFSDTLVPGLRVLVRKTGLISFHVQYTLEGDKGEDDTRPFLKIGDYPAMSITRARNLAKTILSLADKGIDVQAGLHDRLMRELEERGEKWRP